MSFLSKLLFNFRLPTFVLQGFLYRVSFYLDVFTQISTIKMGKNLISLLALATCFCADLSAQEAVAVSDSAQTNSVVAVADDSLMSAAESDANTLEVPEDSLLTADSVLVCDSVTNKYSIRVQAGFNLANFNFGKTNLLCGYSLGLTAEYPVFENTYVTAGLLFDLKGGKYKHKGNEYEAQLMYLEIPVRYGYRYDINYNVALFGEVGPYFAAGINGKNKVDDYEYDLFDDDYFRRFDLGMGIVIGAEFIQKISVRLGLDYGFVNLLKDVDENQSSKDMSIFNDSFDKLHNCIYSVRLAYKF